MLPPRDVPKDLRFEEYMKLLMRYQVLEWHRQIATCTTRVVETQPNSRFSEEGQKRLALLLKGLEGVVLVKDSTEEITSAARTLLKATATKADLLMDKFEPMKKAKNGLVSALTVISDTVKGTIEQAIENHVLPAVGLPLYEIPAGRTAEEYLFLARRYDAFGLPEGARAALEQVMDDFPDSAEAVMARNRLKCRVPRKRVRDEAQRKFFAATRARVIQQKEEARNICEKLILSDPDFEWPYAMLAVIKLKEGDLERSRDLIAMARRINDSSIRLESAQAAVDLAEWNLAHLEKVLARIESLDPEDESINKYRSFLDFIKQQGLTT